MRLSIFELFHIGIGPSSSHTVGPMKAAKHFVQRLIEQQEIQHLKKIQVDLYGSLALTGKGHGTDKALLLGLSGKSPETIDPSEVEEIVSEIKKTQMIKFATDQVFKFKEDIVFNYNRRLQHHSNGMKFSAFDQQGKLLREEIYYSIGGGAIKTEKEMEENPREEQEDNPPYPFRSAKEILEMGEKSCLSLSAMMWENEIYYHPEKEEGVRRQILQIWKVMQDCVERGIHSEGVLPGGLKVRKRAKGIYQILMKEKRSGKKLSDLGVLDWVNLYALSVNEENASGGKVVTAPTNGASGIIPAILHYYINFCEGTEEGVVQFFLAAGAIGLIYKMNASISGAEVGCQGEVGVASSMAAAGLTEVLGGNLHQVENAAEIAMEHHLGLTCDPIGGLVQIPCIERNAMGAVKAINASRMAMLGDGQHFVSLDKVIETMRQTGMDMNTKYKETGRGGLAVHVNTPEC